MRAKVFGFLMMGSCVAIMYGEDITIPLEGGKVVIRNAQFTPAATPELSFKIENQTSQPWWTLTLRFDIAGTCDGKIHRWSVPATTSLGWSEDHFVGNAYREEVDTQIGKVDGCHTDSISAKLVLAQNSNHRVLAPEEAKKEELEAARQKRLTAERNRKRAEEEAKSAEEQRKIREACSALYQNTADKKIKDLTVREDQQVRACQALDLYPPQ
jgi:hypothetical protein